MLHREPNPQSMEAIENHCNTETGKDSAIPKSYRPISLQCHMYKLYERLILNRIAPSVREILEEHMSEYSMYDPMQSAYKLVHSTETAL